MIGKLMRLFLPGLFVSCAEGFTKHCLHYRMVRVSKAGCKDASPDENTKIEHKIACCRCAYWSYPDW